MDEKEKYFTINDNDQLIISRSKTFQDIRLALVIIFFIFLITSVCYWAYEVYNIYNIDLKTLSSIEEVAHYTAHEVAAFQAAVLSFLLTAGAYRL